MKTLTRYVLISLLALPGSGLAVLRPAAATVRAVPVPYGTIQAALDSCADFDTVLVAPGIYSERIVVPSRPLTLASRDDDPATTIMDGSESQGDVGAPLIRVNHSSRGAQILRGFTIRKGVAGLVGVPTEPAGNLIVRHNRFAENGPLGAVSHQGGHLTLWDNEFVDNYVGAGGWQGVVTIRGAATVERNLFERNRVHQAELSGGRGALSLFDEFLAVQPISFLIRTNQFRHNESTEEGGALYILSPVAQATIEGNRLEHNRSGVAGAGVYASCASLDMNKNVFIANEAPHGSAIYSSTDNASFFQNTIVGGAEYASGELVLIELARGPIAFSYNIVAYGAGAGVRWEDAPGSVSCNDLYGNSGEAWTGTFPFGSVTNFARDPLFCDRAAGDLTLATNSPCLPAAHPCDGSAGIGALGEGCSGVAVQELTWSRLKAMFDAPVARPSRPR